MHSTRGLPLALAFAFAFAVAVAAPARADDAAPAAPAAPSDTPTPDNTPTPVATPEDGATPVTPPPDAIPPKPLPPPDGTNPFVTGLAQTGAGAGLVLTTYGVTTGLGALSKAVPASAPVIGPIQLALGTYTCCLQPGVVGYLETWLGDAIGTKRAAALGPILAGYGGCIVGGGLATGLYLAIIGGAIIAALTDPVALAALLASPAILLIGIGINVMVALIIGAAPAITYQLFGEPAKPGAPAGMPGFTAPNNNPPPGRTAARATRPTTLAMAY